MLLGSNLELFMDRMPLITSPELDEINKFIKDIDNLIIGNSQLIKGYNSNNSLQRAKIKEAKIRIDDLLDKRFLYQGARDAVIVSLRPVPPRHSLSEHIGPLH